MASAGQAQAHSSQPMHFSRPSGCRFSWWRPWNRLAVGTFSKGYCSVTGLRNMVPKVTPNPLMPDSRPGSGEVALLLSSATGDLPGVVGLGARPGPAGRGALGGPLRAALHDLQRRHREGGGRSLAL